MKLIAAEAISKSLTKKASTKYIIPDSLDRDVTLRITEELWRAKWKGWIKKILYFYLLIVHML